MKYARIKLRCSPAPRMMNAFPVVFDTFSATSAHLDSSMKGLMFSTSFSITISSGKVKQCRFAATRALSSFRSMSCMWFLAHLNRLLCTRHELEWLNRLKACLTAQWEELVLARDGGTRYVLVPSCRVAPVYGSDLCMRGGVQTVDDTVPETFFQSASATPSYGSTVERDLKVILGVPTNNRSSATAQNLLSWRGTYWTSSSHYTVL